MSMFKGLSLNREDAIKNIHDLLEVVSTLKNSQYSDEICNELLTIALEYSGATVLNTCNPHFVPAAVPRLPERISIRRKSLGITREQIAKHLNVKTKAISMWELGTSSPTINQIAWLSDVLQCDSSWLAFGTGHINTAANAGTTAQGCQP